MVLHVWRNPLLVRSFQWPNVLVNFFAFLSNKFASFRSRQAEIIIVKRFIPGRNNVTRMQVELRSCDQGRPKNNGFTLPATLLSKCLRRCEKFNYICQCMDEWIQLSFIDHNYNDLGFNPTQVTLLYSWIMRITAIRRLMDSSGEQT